MIYENYNVYDPPHIKLGGHTRGVQVCALYVIHNQWSGRSYCVLYVWKYCLLSKYVPSARYTINNCYFEVLIILLLLVHLLLIQSIIDRSSSGINSTCKKQRMHDVLTVTCMMYWLLRTGAEMGRRLSPQLVQRLESKSEKKKKKTYTAVYNV